MRKKRDPRIDQAHAIWLESGGEKGLAEIATELGVSAATVRSWKSRYKWVIATQQRNAKMKRNSATAQPEEDPDRLPDKYGLFAAEYLRDFNATRAAMAVGYKKNIAHTMGWRLLKKDEVQAEIKRLKEIRTEELGLDVNRVIAEHMKIAFADITDIIGFEDGALALSNGGQIDGSVISEIKQGRDGISIKMHDKMRALEKLERYLDYMTTEDQLRVDKLRAEIKALEEGGNW